MNRVQLRSGPSHTVTALADFIYISIEPSLKKKLVLLYFHCSYSSVEYRSTMASPIEDSYARCLSQVILPKRTRLWYRISNTLPFLATAFSFHVLSLVCCALARQINNENYNLLQRFHAILVMVAGLLLLHSHQVAFANYSSAEIALGCKHSPVPTYFGFAQQDVLRTIHGIPTRNPKEP